MGLVQSCEILIILGVFCRILVNLRVKYAVRRSSGPCGVENWDVSLIVVAILMVETITTTLIRAKSGIISAEPVHITVKTGVRTCTCHVMQRNTGLVMSIGATGAKAVSKVPKVAKTGTEAVGVRGRR